MTSKELDLRRRQERLIQLRPDLKPIFDKLWREEEARQPKVLATVSPKVAEAIKDNPKSVRVSARASDGTAVFQRPRTVERVEVMEVDGEGRPKVARCYNASTNEWSTIEYRSGYRHSGGAAHQYNPIDALGD